MRYITLGRTEISVSYMGLGCGKLGSVLGGCHGPSATRLVERALDHGITSFDTANIYGQGESERLLGEVLRSRRDKVVIATKAGQTFSARDRKLAALKAPIRALAVRVPVVARAVARRRTASLPRNYDPLHLREALEGSLRRLRTDYVDIFYLHSPRAEDVLSEDALHLMGTLKSEGKIRAWGVSCDDTVDLPAILRRTTPDVVQLPISGMADAFVIAECTKLQARGQAIVVRGIVGKATANATFPPDSDRPIRSAWKDAMAAPLVTAALCGTTSVDHLDENVAALGAAEEEARGLRRALSP